MSNEGDKCIEWTIAGAEYDNVDPTVNLVDDVDDTNDHNVDVDIAFSKDENEWDEGDIPDWDLSDTAVQVDFDANLEPL